MESGQPNIIEELQTLPVPGTTESINVVVCPGGKQLTVKGDGIQNQFITIDRVVFPEEPERPEGYAEMDDEDSEKTAYDALFKKWEDLRTALRTPGATIKAVATFVVESVNLVTDDIRVLQAHQKQPDHFAEGILHVDGDDDTPRKKKKKILSGTVTLHDDLSGVERDFRITQGVKTRGNPKNGKRVVFHPRLQVKKVLERVEVVLN